MAKPLHLAAAALAGIGVACILWQFRPDGTAAPPPLPPADSVAPAGFPTPAPVERVPVQKVPTAPPRTEGQLELPDGTSVPPLNGVVNPPRLVWTNPEYSPIVRTEHNGDYDWYVHADGSYSTTLMIWRSDLKRADACSYCLHPRDAVPVAPTPPEGALPPGGTDGKQ